MSYDHDGGQIFSPDPSETTLVGEDGEISRGAKGLKCPTRWNICVRRCPGLCYTPNPPVVSSDPFFWFQHKRFACCNTNFTPALFCSFSQLIH